MKDAPIPPVLDLWSLGHSATDICAKLGFPNRRHVERIIERARSIRDPRAVYHVAGDRILGTGIPKSKRYLRGFQTEYDGVLLVERILKRVCPRGHMRLPQNVDAQGHCIQCERRRRR